MGWMSTEIETFIRLQLCSCIMCSSRPFCFWYILWSALLESLSFLLLISFGDTFCKHTIDVLFFRTKNQFSFVLTFQVRQQHTQAARTLMQEGLNAKLPDDFDGKKIFFVSAREISWGEYSGYYFKNPLVKIKARKSETQRYT